MLLHLEGLTGMTASDNVRGLYQQRSVSKTSVRDYMCTRGSSPAYRMPINESPRSTAFIILIHLVPGLET